MLSCLLLFLCGRPPGLAAKPAPATNPPAGIQVNLPAAVSPEGLPWWALPLLALCVLNTGAIFWLFRQSKFAGEANAHALAQISARTTQLQTAIQGDSWQAAQRQALTALEHAAEAQKTLALILADFRAQPMPAAPPHEPSPSTPEPSPPAPLSETDTASSTLKPQEEGLNPMKQKREAPRQNGGRTQALEKVLWPAAFRDGGALANWREVILEATAQGDLLAAGLLLDLLRIEFLCRQPDLKLPPIAATLHGLSLQAHRFWQTRPGDHDDTALRWRDAFNALIAGRSLPLEIQAIHPQDRFDTNRMICAEGSSGSRLYVKEPLSWVVLDKSNPEHPVVLHHGVVVTV